MASRSSVNFSATVEPIFKKYANTYGVKNVCSLGVILIDRLEPTLREELMGLVGSNADPVRVTFLIGEAETAVILRAIDAGPPQGKPNPARKGRKSKKEPPAHS